MVVAARPVTASLDSIYEGGLPIETIFGLPVHPLATHAVVVLLPLASVGLIVSASGIKRSKRYGGVVALLAGLAALSAFIAMASGRDLAARLGYGQQQHFELGEWMPWVGFAVFGAATLLWLLDKKPPTRGGLGKIVALVSIVVGVVAIVATVYVGYLGASLTWG